MKAVILFFAVASNLVSLVAAHGYVSNIVADGKKYVGGIPNQKFPDSPIRLIDDPSPVKDLNGPQMICGPDAKPGKLIATVTAGSDLTIGWASGENGPWPHNTGPIIDYLASCDGSCDDFDPSNAKWFKIQQVARRPDGLWRQQDLFEGKTVKTTIPKNLPAGNYMLRHEILALHLAENLGGIEVYPSCIQLSVKSSGSGSNLDASKLGPTATFPGAYKLRDPGILDKNAFDPNADYPFPGPPIADFITNDNNDGGNDNDNDNGKGNSAQNPDNTASSTESAVKSPPTSPAGGSGSGSSNTGNNQQQPPKGADSSSSGRAGVESSTVARTTSTAPEPSSTPAPSSTPSVSVSADPSVVTVVVTVTVTATATGTNSGSVPTATVALTIPVPSSSVPTDPAGSAATSAVIDGVSVSVSSSASPASASASSTPTSSKIQYRHVGRLSGPHRMVRVHKRAF